MEETMTRRVIGVWLLASAIGFAGPAVAQTPAKQEVEVRVTTLAAVQTQLDSLPNGAELHARGLVLNDASAFTGSEFTNLVSAVQNKPGTEVKIQGVIVGADGTRRPFEAKVEAGEVKLRGLTLNGSEFNTLLSQLQNTGVRELKIRAVVDGRSMVVKFENGQLRTRTEVRDGNRGPGSDHGGRDRSRVEKMEKVDKIDKPERVEKVERAEKVDRLEKPERSGRH